jgi:hypothetical protein
MSAHPLDVTDRDAVEALPAQVEERSDAGLDPRRSAAAIAGRMQDLLSR